MFRRTGYASNIIAALLHSGSLSSSVPLPSRRKQHAPIAVLLANREHLVPGACRNRGRVASSRQAGVALLFHSTSLDGVFLYTHLYRGVTRLADWHRPRPDQANTDKLDELTL